ncbi:MAG: hypothetical protein JWQ94_23 [Tardiphaga sp.]|jgi:hypothetical protein|nr:hypothetical protein [Tardiphaga sp.]
MAPSTDGDCVVSQTTEVINLATYRERKAEQRRAAKAAANPHGGQPAIMPMAIAVPMMCLIYWPTWVFAPAAVARNEGGSGAA